MANRFFLCYREDSADFAKHLSEHINKNEEVYGGAYYSDYHAHGNYLSMAEIGKIFDEVEYFVCCAGKDIVKGFFLPNGEFNKECATALEFVSAETRRQRGEIKFIIVNYNNYEFTEEDLDVLEKLYREFEILREDSVDAIKNANRNYYDKRQTDTEMFYSRLLRGMELVKQESQEDVIRKLIEERIAQMMGGMTAPKAESSELERLKKENEALKRKLTSEENKKTPKESAPTVSNAEEYRFDTFNMPKADLPFYSTPCSYNAPPMSILRTSEKISIADEAEKERVVSVIEDALETFSVHGKVVAVNKGAQCTRYEISLTSGTTINKFKNLKNDLQMILSARSLRIIAPVPGKNTVAIELPNENREQVELSSVISSKEFQKSVGGVQVALGQSVDGVEICDITKLPHLLIGGESEGGKSAFLDALIVSIAYKYSPEDVRLMLVDVGGLDFNKYKGLPHLLLPDVLNKSEYAVAGMKWLNEEIKRRYELLLSVGKRNVEDYNAISDKAMKLPRIILVVNECASVTRDVREWQEYVAKIGQMGRGAGIHLILATKNPSVSVITGVIKVNVPARIAFNTISAMDSRTIIDDIGAESLLGKGDMLFNDGKGMSPKRIQGAYVTDQEISEVCRYVIANNDCNHNEDLWVKITSDKGTEILLYKIMREFIKERHASVSLIQRRFSIGFMRASKYMDELAKRGFIERNEKGTYDVLITAEQFKKLFG